MSSVSAKAYQRPPIVEALVELTFAPSRPWDEAARAALNEKIGHAYQGKRDVQSRVHVHAEPAKGSSEAKVTLHQLLFHEADGKACVGVGENILAVHVFAPYPGWAAFLPRVSAAIELYQAAMKPLGVATLAVRYIDQIALPAESDDFSVNQYFPCMPGRPQAMPPNLNGFHVVTQTVDPVLNYAAALTLASLPPREPNADGAQLVLYDLTVWRGFEPPQPASSMVPHVEFLHDRQKQIFEDSITPATRELFQ